MRTSSSGETQSDEAMRSACAKSSRPRRRPMTMADGSDSHATSTSETTMVRGPRPSRYTMAATFLAPSARKMAGLPRRLAA
eukprot:scaffold31923_cov112-Isochrysis_galbana.AAC.4